MQKLKLNDEVIVIAGKDKGKKGKIVKFNGPRKRVFVEGVNVVKKTMKPTQENPNGGVIDIEASIDVSNIALVSPKTGKATRVRIDNVDGKNVRTAVSCGSRV